MGDPCTPEIPGSDVARLRARHPRWTIGAVWTSRASGADVRRLSATREGVSVYAWDEGGLSAEIRAEESERGWPAS